MRGHFIAAAALAALAALASGSTAWAAWGCAARGDHGGWGNSFGQATKSEAEEAALRACGPAGCRIIGCSAEADTRDQARALWPIPSPPTSCSGSGCQ